MDAVLFRAPVRYLPHPCYGVHSSTTTAITTTISCAWIMMLENDDDFPYHNYFFSHVIWNTLLCIIGFHGVWNFRPGLPASP